VARSTYFYTDSRVLGGAEKAMFTLLELLDREAWQPTLLLDDAVGTESLSARAEELEIPVRRVAPMPLGLSGARRLPAMIRLLRAERPDVFHAHMSSPVAAKYPLAAAVMARVPAVLGTVHVAEFVPPDHSTYWQLRALSRGVDRYLTVSRDIAVELVERLDWPADKIEVVYNGVDTDRFEMTAPPGLRDELGGGGGRPIVLTPARLNEQKGHPVLLEAVAEVPDAVFVLAGDGPERQALETLAEQLGVTDRVRFLGHRTDIPQLLAAADVFALPSLYEGSSLAVLEAMAAGIPIVSSAIGGTDELIEQGRSGLLVPAGDAKALAAALRRVLADRALWETFAARARERVERDLTRERMVHRVMAVYEEILGGTNNSPAALPESRRNAVLRREDWRFLLPGEEEPASEQLTIAGFPTAGVTRAALDSLAPGGELVCSWRWPRIGAAVRARRRLEATGLVDVRVYWAGPLPHRLPQFWLPLGSAGAERHLLASRPARSLAGRALRMAWRLAARMGLLAPLYVLARVPGAGREDEIPVPAGSSLLLLTGGHRSINKVVGLAIPAGGGPPTMAIKFARVAEAEPGLEREAMVLRRLNEERPGLGGVPKLRGSWRRGGRLAVGEDAVEGDSLLAILTPGNFADLAQRVTDLLIELAQGEARPATDWRERLVEFPLDRFERSYGAAAAPQALAGARRLLAGLGDLASACEHRDCSPWNVVLGRNDEPVLLDWESSEPDGLPGLDLVYFLANCAFVLDRAIESGSTRESYSSLLDPTTANGRVAAAAMDRYSTALGIGLDDFRRLRLLCWIVHSRSDYLHLQLETAGAAPASEQLSEGVFLGLVEEELGRGQPG
jgi:glycosyltransferase involved in cell wall biosynthesis